MSRWKKIVIAFLFSISGFSLCSGIWLLQNFWAGQTVHGDSYESLLCEHRWQDGACLACGVTCRHEHWDDGRCALCGLTCEHPAWSECFCTRCGKACDHLWSEGSCETCGLSCEHDFAYSACVICSLACEHEWHDGRCAVCGDICQHQWCDGVCTNCQLVCDHRQHDPDTLVCRACGAFVYHNFCNGVCRDCGWSPTHRDVGLPDFYFDEEVPAGYIEATRINNVDAWVYTPPGYDSREQYDVLIMLHGNGGNGRGVLIRPVDFRGQTLTPTVILDHMFAEHRTRPMIVVTFTYANTWRHADISNWIRNSLLPYLAYNYGTYAEDGSLESLQKARQHFAIGGMSLGADITWSTLLPNNMDVFGNFVPVSGFSPKDYVVNTIRSKQDDAYPMHCLIYATGLSDKYGSEGLPLVEKLVNEFDWLRTGTNVFVDRPEGGHEYRAYWTSYYNTIPYLFQDIVLN